MRSSVAVRAARRGSARGWSGFRRRELPGGGFRIPRESRKLRDVALNAALRACAGAGHSVVGMQVALLRAARGQFVPDPHVLAGIVSRAAAEAAACPPVEGSGAGGADAAAEAFARLVDCRLGRPSPPLLSAVAREAARDPVAERRSARVLSVIARLRSLKTAPTPELISACFDTAVAAVDLQLAAALYNFALANGLCVLQTPVSSAHLSILRRSAFPVNSAAFIISGDQGAGEDKSSTPPPGVPPALKFYNGVFRAAIFTDSHEVAAATFRELHARGVGINVETLALLSAFHANLQDMGGARDIVVGLKEAGEKVPSVAYAALVRYFGKKRDFGTARMLFDEWEKANFADFNTLLSSPCKAGRDECNRVSAKTVASARDCVVLAMFLAGRAAADSEGVVNFLQYLEETYGYKCSRFVESVVTEACWRSGRQDLAEEVLAKIKHSRQ